MIHHKTGDTSARVLLAIALLVTGSTLVTGALTACSRGEVATAQQAPPPAASVAADADGSTASKLAGGGLPPGCRCHSRVEWQVAMHKLFSARDCMKCHTENENLMAPQGTRMTAAHLKSLEQRMRTEPVCLECHKAGKTSVPSRFTAMKGALYCPTDGRMYARSQAIAKVDDYFCPDHGTKLVDVDAVTAASEKKPSNAYCVACHRKTAPLVRKHAGVAQAAGVSDLSDCLSCHPGHSKCGSCHT